MDKLSLSSQSSQQRYGGSYFHRHRSTVENHNRSRCVRSESQGRDGVPHPLPRHSRRRHRRVVLLLRRIRSRPPRLLRGLVCCGTGVGVAMFANKFPGVYAATCLTVEDAANARSISDCNVLALSGAKTSPETAAEIFDGSELRSNHPAPLPDRSRGAPRSPPSSTTPSPRWIRSENQPPAIRLLVRSAAWRRTESSLRWRSCREDR